MMKLYERCLLDYYLRNINIFTSESLCHHVLRCLTEHLIPRCTISNENGKLNILKTNSINVNRDKLN